MIELLTSLTPTSLKLAGAGCLLVLAGLFSWGVYRAGMSKARWRLAEKGNQHAREAQQIDERVHIASDDELERLYGESLD